MVNAGEEFLRHVKGRVVKCVNCYTFYDKLELPLKYTEEEWKLFLIKLDFEFDLDFFHSNYYGVIWYRDGTWSKRYYNNNCVEWEFIEPPTIPKHLQRN